MTTAAIDSTPSIGLSFPAETFRKLAPSSYLIRHLQSTPPTRPSTRTPEQFRTPTLHTSSLSHCHGSAVVRSGDTAVVCGVRGEILNLTHGSGRTKGQISVRRNGVEEADEIKTHSLLVPNLELGTGCSANYHPGPPTDFAQTTSERLRTLLVDVADIIPSSTLHIYDADGELKAYWTLYIDIVCISLDGSVFDTAWTSIIAALRDTKLPLAKWDADTERVVCEYEYRALEMRDLVFAASFGVVEAEDEGEGEEKLERERWCLSELDEFEEGVCEERVSVVVREDGRVVKVDASGGTADVVGLVGACVGKARERCKELVKLVKASA